MNRAEHLYGLASQCYRCHTLGDDELVEVGGHPVPRALDLLFSLQGDLRHNYTRGEPNVNTEPSKARCRIMFVLGQGLKLEYALRALAAARDGGALQREMRARVASAIESLERIERAAGIAELDEILRTVRSAPQQGAGLERVAREIGALLQRFDATHEGAALASLDSLIPAMTEQPGPTASAP